MIYLAQPYAHPEPSVRQDRARQGMQVCATLMTAGFKMFSPIAHCHHMAEYFPMPDDHDFWLAYDFHILRRCDSIAVLKLTGWEKSIGVRAELLKAREWELGVFYIDNISDPLFHSSSASQLLHAMG